MADGCGQEVIEIPPATGLFAEPWSVRRVWALLRCFGPAAILASMSIGAGETIVVVRAGAWARYDLLWVVLLSCLVKGVFVTYMLGRYTAISGQHVGHRLVEVPGPRGWLLLAIIGVEVAFAPLAWVAIARPCGNLVHFLVGYDFLGPMLGGRSGAANCEKLYTTLFITAALLLSLTLNYERLEREQLVICGILVSGTVVGTLLVRPDLWSALKGALWRMGRLPDTVPPWAPADAKRFPLLNLATVFAYVGGSVSGYIAYANWVGIRRWGLTGHPRIEQIRRLAAGRRRIDYLPSDPASRRRLAQLTAPLRWDVALGAAVLFFVTAAFMMSGAAALYDKHSRFEGWRLLTDQAYVWRNIHRWLVPVYYVTVLAALWGTLTALPEVYTRISQEFFRAVWPQRRWSFAAIERVIVCLLFVGCCAVIWSDVEFDLLTQIAGLVVANLAISVIAVAALYLNYKLPRAYRACRPLLIGAVASTGILVAASSLSTYGLVRKLVGPRQPEAAAGQSAGPAGRGLDVAGAHVQAADLTAHGQ